MNNEILRSLSYGVYVISTHDDIKQTGCIANSLMQITSDTVALSLNHDNYTNECIKKNKKFAVSILSQDVDDNIIPTFGFQSGKNINKFDNIEQIRIDNLSIIKNSIGYLICEVKDIVETSTHSVFIAKILDGDVFNNQTPMTYAYYHKVKKGSSPKNAPTYIKPKKSVGYRCKFCGYLYEGDFESLPDDFICPVCKQPKSSFEKAQ